MLLDAPGKPALADAGVAQIKRILRDLNRVPEIDLFPPHRYAKVRLREILILHLRQKRSATNKLTDRQKIILEILKGLPDGERLQAKGIHRGLPKAIRDDCTPSTMIRHDLPSLRKYGLIKNERGRGYYATTWRA
jgi:hypothetical protein